jgi:hypothetical protein
MIEFVAIALIFYVVGRLSVSTNDRQWIEEKINKIRLPKPKQEVGAIDYLTKGQREELENEDKETKYMRSLFRDVLKIKPKPDNID